VVYSATKTSLIGVFDLYTDRFGWMTYIARCQDSVYKTLKLFDEPVTQSGYGYGL
jgi:hypothetical protein